MASNNTSSSSSSSPQPHFCVFFIPWYATGHLLPMADIASLFAARSVSSTILTTAANAALIQPTINHLSSSLPIRTLLYPFPSYLSNLPPNAENIAAVPAADSHKLDVATLHSRPAIESLIRLYRPKAIVADIHFTWIFELAMELNILFLVFHAVGLFPVSILGAVTKFRPNDDVDDDNVPFLIPGLPHDIRMVGSELPSFFHKGRFDPTTYSNEENIWSKMKEMQANCFGFIVNSFAEMESEYADYILSVQGKRSWLVGPVAVATMTIDSQNEKQFLAVRRGREQDGNSDRCLAWLDKQLPKSVVYVCFGSWCHFSDDQIRQLALGLESCGHPFLWVVREDSVGFSPHGFEERVKGKGLVVRGWAPQAAVLGHVAVGGFLTHCRWNSLLEGLAAGLPMATWPLVFEQFINEKLVIDVLRVGVKCRRGGGVGSTVEEEKVVVREEEVATAVGRIMSKEEEEAEAMRRRAEEYAAKAKEAVREGGSSYNELTNLIEELKAWPKSNNHF